MKLSVGSWSFPKCTLAEAGAIAAALGIEGIDIGYFYAASLDRARVLDDPALRATIIERAAQYVASKHDPAAMAAAYLEVYGAAHGRAA